MKKIISIALVATLATVSLTACGNTSTNTPKETTKSTTITESETTTAETVEDVNLPGETVIVPTAYNFSLQLPVGWDEKCEVVPSDSSDFISLYTKSIKGVEDEYQGWLGTFKKISEESLTYDEFVERSEELTGGMAHRYMYSDESGTYGISYPSELQWNPDIEGQVDEWVDMFALMNEIALVNENGEVISVDPSVDDIEFINNSVSDIRGTTPELEEPEYTEASLVETVPDVTEPVTEETNAEE